LKALILKTLILKIIISIGRIFRFLANIIK
jgi:hypothetical protein